VTEQDEDSRSLCDSKATDQDHRGAHEHCISVIESTIGHPGASRRAVQAKPDACQKYKHGLSNEWSTCTMRLPSGWVSVRVVESEHVVQMSQHPGFRVIHINN